jgi:hypothetical protein
MSVGLEPKRGSALARRASEGPRRRRAERARRAIAISQPDEELAAQIVSLLADIATLCRAERLLLTEALAAAERELAAEEVGSDAG